MSSGGASARLHGAAALPLRALHARAAAARAGSPRAPGAPAAVDRVGTVTHGHALAVEAPLQRDRPEEEKTRFKDAIIDVESESLAAGSTEAQHPYGPVKIHASLARRCLGFSWALPEPGAPLSNAKFRDVGLFEHLCKATYPNRHRDPSARGFITRSQPRGKSQRGIAPDKGTAGGFPGSGG